MRRRRQRRSGRDAVSWVWACALAIAVARRSVKSPTRASVSGGRGSGPVDPTTAEPHRLPSTTIGTPTSEFCALSIRAAWPVPKTRAEILLPSTGSVWLVTNVDVPSGVK